MGKLLEAAFERIDKKVKELKVELRQERDLQRALHALNEEAGQVKQQLEILTGLPLPTDILDFYIKQSGNVWVSKLRGIGDGDEVTVSSHSRTLTCSSDRRGIRLPPGAYRFVLLAIPQEIKREQLDRDSYFFDEYGDRFDDISIQGHRRTYKRG